jgi:hypothetical protein
VSDAKVDRSLQRWQFGVLGVHHRTCGGYG